MIKENELKLRPKLFTKDFICTVITNLLFCTYSQMFMATAPLFAVSIGHSETAAGLLTTIFGLSCFLFRPLAGYLVDNAKRKNTVLCGLVVFAVAAAAFPFLKQYGLMLAARFIQGMAISLAVTALGTIAADIIPPERFSEGIGYYGLGVSIMSLLSPGVGLSIIHSSGFKNMFLSLSMIAAVGFFTCAAVNYKEQHLTSDKPKHSYR